MRLHPFDYLIDYFAVRLQPDFPPFPCVSFINVWLVPEINEFFKESFELFGNFMIKSVLELLENPVKVHWVLMEWIWNIWHQLLNGASDKVIEWRFLRIPSLWIWLDDHSLEQIHFIKLFIILRTFRPFYKIGVCILIDFDIWIPESVIELMIWVNSVGWNLAFASFPIKRTFPTKTLLTLLSEVLIQIFPPDFLSELSLFLLELRTFVFEQIKHVTLFAQFICLYRIKHLT